MELHRQGRARVVPILLRPCSLQGTPLAPLVPLPRDGRPSPRPRTAMLPGRRLPASSGRSSASLARRRRRPRPGLRRRYGQTASRSSAASPPPRTRAPLFLDRNAQWGELQREVAAPAHQVILLPGERGQGHEYFMMRVQLALPRDPPRRILSIDWKVRPFPRIRKDFLGALADALGCPRPSSAPS